MSKREVLPALIAALVLYSCGLDGGSRGTGVTALISGNVAGVRMSAGLTPLRDGNSAQFARAGDLFDAPQANAAGSVQGITVTVEPRGGQSTTNSAGLFSVRGAFEGSLTLLFTRARDSIRASMTVDIPAGGVLRLNNVRINRATGTAAADSENVEFLGDIVQVNCTSQTLLMISSQRGPNDHYSYTVRLDTSLLRDPLGDPITCADLRKGQMAHVQGTVNADGSFGHALIVVD